MNLFIDAMSKTGSFLLVNVLCFQSVIWTADCRQSRQSVQKGKVAGKRRYALWRIAGEHQEQAKREEDGA